MIRFVFCFWAKETKNNKITKTETKQKQTNKQQTKTNKQQKMLLENLFPPFGTNQSDNTTSEKNATEYLLNYYRCLINLLSNKFKFSGSAHSEQQFCVLSCLLQNPKQFKSRLLLLLQDFEQKEEPSLMVEDLTC